MASLCYVSRCGHVAQHARAASVKTSAMKPATLRTAIARPSVSVRSIPVSGPGSGPKQVEVTGAPAGQISAELMASMKAKIAEALETDRVEVTDVYGDARHVSISVISKAFEGKNAVQRQRMVYKAIWLELQEAVHAVDDMTTKTPAELGL